MPTYVLERVQIIERSRAETFAFFSEAFNLERITPPFLRFRILTPPPILMQAGALLQYRLSLFGIRFNWLTRIESWSPDESFVDAQLSGPYAHWRHTHTFTEVAARRTLMRDRVQYAIPYGILGRIAHGIFVKRTLKRIFDYRAALTARLLAPGGADPARSDNEPQRAAS